MLTLKMPQIIRTGLRSPDWCTNRASATRAHPCLPAIGCLISIQYPYTVPWAAVVCMWYHTVTRQHVAITCGRRFARINLDDIITSVAQLQAT